MNINISPINSFRYKNFKITNTTKPEEPTKETVLPNYRIYSNINFQAKTLKLRKPVLENPETQKLADKISSFLEKLPQNFNIKKPILVKLNEDIVGFTIDRTDENKTKLVIKRKEHSEKINEWNSNDEFCEILNIVLNNNNQMVEGSYTEPGIWGYGYLFERNNRNIRRLKMGGHTYIPAANDVDTWKAIKKDERLIMNNSIPFSPEDYKLRYLFNELMKLDSAL